MMNLKLKKVMIYFIENTN